MTVTLSIIQHWTPDHLRDFATHFTDLSNRRIDTTAGINAVAGTQIWDGLGRVGQEGTLAKVSAVSAEHAASMTAAAGVATDGALTLYGIQQSILTTVRAAVPQGFQVGENWDVKDVLAPPGTPAYRAREPIAQAMSQQLRTAAQGFEAQENATAAGITSASSPLHIRDVDNPTPAPSPPPAPNPGIQAQIGGQPSFAPPDMPAAGETPGQAPHGPGTPACEGALATAESDRERKLLERALAGAAVGGAIAGVPDGGAGWVPGAITGAGVGTIYGLLDQATTAHPLPPECQ